MNEGRGGEKVRHRNDSGHRRPLPIICDDSLGRSYFYNTLVRRADSSIAILYRCKSNHPRLNDQLILNNFFESYSNSIQKSIDLDQTNTSKISSLFIKKKICSLRSHILISRFARSSLRSQKWARLGRAT